MTSLPTDLPYHVTASLARAHIGTVEDALLRPANELGYLLQRSLADVHQLRGHLAAHLAAQHTTATNFSDALVGVTAHRASDLLTLRLQSRLPLGDPVLDRFLHGGLPWPGVVEVAGPAGAGKSQLCFHVMARVLALFPPSTRLVHISSESTLPVHRILQLVPPQLITQQPALLDRIVSETISDMETLLYWLTYRLPLLLTPPPPASSTCSSPDSGGARLLVLDSLTPLVRGGSTPGDPTAPPIVSLKSRHALLADLARTLQKLAHVYQLTVLVVNQAAADPNLHATRQALRAAPRNVDALGRGYLVAREPHVPAAQSVAGPLWRAHDGARKTSALALQPVRLGDAADNTPAARMDKVGGPALGLEWARAVHHRVYLARIDAALPQADTVQATRASIREMYVLAGMGVPNSLEAETQRVRFEIGEHGLVGVPEQDM